MKTHCLVAAVLLVFLALPSLEAQTKKRLAILPFSGGQAQDGETISILLSNQRTLLDAFTVQPRNSAIDRIMGEQQFQRQSGLINSGAISEIGKMNTTDLVVSGYIARLGDTSLLIISIVDVTEIQQIAGVYQPYRSIEEVRGLLPNLTQRLVEASKKETSKAGFMQSASMMIGNSLINRIPRNSRIAILIHGDTVQADYWKNELHYILSNSNRFRIIDQERADIEINKVGSLINVQDMLRDYFDEEKGWLTENLTVITDNGFDTNALSSIGRALDANVVIQFIYTDKEYSAKSEVKSVEIEFSELTIQIQALTVNTLESISNSKAYWCWPENGTSYIE
jgi:hypothetical protein